MNYVALAGHEVPYDMVVVPFTKLAGAEACVFVHVPIGEVAAG